MNISTSHQTKSPPHPEIGWILWGAVFLVIAILVGHHPEVHTVTPEYRGAAEQWFHSEDIYQTKLHTMHGFLYFPSSALLYWPITLLPFSLGEVVWRLCSLLALATGVWRLSGLVLGQQRDRWFWLVTLLTLSASLASARNGQTNMPLAAFMAHAAVDLAGRRWNRASLWLALTLLLKPISLVMILLTFVLYAPMRLRLIVGLLGVAILPWINPDWRYVWSEHLLFIEKMKIASSPDGDNFCDLRGLLLQLGLNPADGTLMIIRALAAGATLALCYVCSSQSDEERRKAFFIAALSAGYLMIFNPRTETNSYVILAPFIVTFAIRKGVVEGVWVQSFLLCFLALTLGSDGYGAFIFNSTNLWLKVSSAIVFVLILSREILLNVPWKESNDASST